MFELNIEKILKSVAPDLNIKEIVNESAKVPLILAALIEQSNTQNTALKYIIGKIDAIEKKTDKAQEILDLLDNLVEEDKKKHDSTAPRP